MIVCDTGPLVAAALRADRDHQACVELFTRLYRSGRQILVPGPVVAEAGYLIARQAGARAESLFLTSFAEGVFQLVDLRREDFVRMAELVLTYRDFPLGTTDASVIAVAERLGLSEVATLDHRHFHAVRPRHIEALTLLP